ncbi:hypothetical protein AYI68_g2402 [Smittium mucronatum]|uniref:CCHC-type domain-containing protein n=1 Tax=Smittium mucronatum TaxID=133383 RepID=A0A1R0H2U8_9FUNG|nr:hypothetical protein AYI68_g2402 [Smittium mucronatum]
MDVLAIETNSTSEVNYDKEECIKKGLCFYCKKRDHRAYQCRRNKNTPTIQSIMRADEKGIEQYNEMSTTVCHENYENNRMKPLTLKFTVDSKVYNALVDGGATIDVIALIVVSNLQLQKEYLETPIQIRMAYCKLHQVRYAVTLDIQHEGRRCRIKPLVFDNTKYPFILGRPWLKLNNPSINWRNEIISFDETPPLLLNHIEIKDMI